MSLSCSCDPPANFCQKAQRLYEALVIAEVEAEKLLIESVANRDDQSLRYRSELAYDAERTTRRLYRRHLDGGDEPVDPQSLRHDSPLRGTRPLRSVS